MSSYLDCNLIVFRDNKVLYHKNFDFNYIKDDYRDDEDLISLDEYKENKKDFETIRDYLASLKTTDEGKEDIKNINFYNSISFRKKLDKLEQELKDLDKPIDYSAINSLNLNNIPTEKAITIVKSLKDEIESDTYYQRETLRTELLSLIENYRRLYYTLSLLEDAYEDYASNSKVLVLLGLKLDY